MSKFNVRTGEAQQTVASEPVQELRQRVPQASEGSIFDDLPAQPQVSEAQGPVELPPVADEQVDQIYDLEEQKAREAVTPINQRRTEQRVDRWTSAKQPTETPDGGIEARSQSLVQAANSPEKVARVAVGGPTIQPLLANLGTTQNDPVFLKTLSYVTENFLADTLAGESEVDPQALTDSESELPLDVPKGRPVSAVSKAQGNSQLGQAIQRDYQRLRNSLEGRPTDEYQDLSGDDATLLGDLAKELYFEANKDEMTRALDKDGQVYFTPSSKLQEDFAKGAQFRKRLFPKQQVRPAKTATPKGRLVGEGRHAVKDVTGKVGSAPINDRVLNKAKENLNQVANVVDKRRLRVLLATVLPALMHNPVEYGNNPLLDTYAEINNFGPGKARKFKSQQKIKEKNNDFSYNWQDNIRDVKRDIAQSILGIAQERNHANHLTYGTQAFNGRLSPQQTHFDPTTSKAVRFVTRNSIPAMVTPGSRQERNLIQMYSLIISDKGTDALLPWRRKEEMEKQAPKLQAWGERLKQVLDETMTEAEAEAIAAAIEAGTPINDPSFPKFKPLGLDPERDADLLKAIEKKGEDGPAFIDGLIDFANYRAWKKNPTRPFPTYFNAYIDGKTNGIASNGMQMGSERVALRTGVMRFSGAHAVQDNIDIRDQLMTDLNTDIKMNGFDGALKDDYPELYTLAEAISQHRDLAKKTTMTFGYGKDIDSFKKDIEDAAYEIAEENEAVAEALNNISIDWVTPVLSKYATALEGVLDPEAIESRHMMWGTAVINAMADSLFTMKSYVGQELRFGDTVADGEKDAQVYDVYGAGSDKGRQVGARNYMSRPTSAAARTRTGIDPDTGERVVSEDVGGWAWGGSVPGPVQSLDAATVAMTVTGKSWKRLKDASHGAPYIHSIYDAFKMDANGYDVILDEVNKNWMKATLEWSYLKEARDSFDAAEKAFDEKLKGRSADEVVNLTEEFPFIASLLDPTGSTSGQFPSNMYRKLKALLVHPKGATPDEKHNATIEEVNEIISAIGVGKAMKSGKPITELSVDQVRKFKQQFFGRTRIKRRLDNLIETTEKNKKKLAKKLRGKKIYQYYTH